MNADSIKNWADIKVGDQENFCIKITAEKINSFITLSGDHNLLHQDINFAEQKGFYKPIAHGMLLASFFSALVGNYFLGNNNLYLSQNMQFRKSIFVGDDIKVVGKIIQKIETAKILVIATSILNKDNEVAVSGEAMVKYI